MPISAEAQISGGRLIFKVCETERTVLFKSKFVMANLIRLWENRFRREPQIMGSPRS